MCKNPTSWRVRSGNSWKNGIGRLKILYTETSADLRVHSNKNWRRDRWPFLILKSQSTPTLRVAIRQSFHVSSECDTTRKKLQSTQKTSKKGVLEFVWSSSSLSQSLRQIASLPPSSSIIPRERTVASDHHLLDMSRGGTSSSFSGGLTSPNQENCHSSTLDRGTAAVPAFNNNCVAREHPQTSPALSYNETELIVHPVQTSIVQESKFKWDKSRSNKRARS